MSASAPISPAPSSICSLEDVNHSLRSRRRPKQQWLACVVAVLILQLAVATAVKSTTSLGAGIGRRISFALAKNKPSVAFEMTRSLPRGGSLVEEEEEEEDEEDEDEEDKTDIRQHPEYEKLQSYRMKQQVLLQLRATYLSEALAKRGLPLPSLQDVATPDGKVPPKNVDWECAMSTEEDPRHCLISYEPELGSKVVVPMELASTDKWITLSALNRLRRNDPSKVQPMWNDQYAILHSWFSPQSRYSLLQHVGPRGVILSTLLDGNRLSAVVGILIVAVIVQILPIIEILANRFLVSGYLWINWISWHRYAHMGLPFKLVLIQAIFNYGLKAFSALVSMIKVKLVDLECQILEETIPLTVIPASAHADIADTNNVEEGSSSDTDEYDEE